MGWSFFLFYGGCALDQEPADGEGTRPILGGRGSWRALTSYGSILSSPSPAGTGHPFQPGESALSQNQQDFCPLPAARLALLWLRFLQKSGYCLFGMAGQLSGTMGAVHRKAIIILTYVLAALELTCLFMQFSLLPVSNTHTPHRRPGTAFLVGNGREQGGA